MGTYKLMYSEKVCFREWIVDTKHLYKLADRFLVHTRKEPYFTKVINNFVSVL